MQTFPAQYTTLSAPALGQFIEQQYGFTVTSCKLLLRGVSDTYVVKTVTTKYILKVYRSAHRSYDEVSGEVELLNLLKEKNCSVAYPIADLKGGQVQEFNAAEGPRYGVLYSFAAGEATHALTDERLRIVGREMATIHNATAAIELRHSRKEYNVNTTAKEPLRILADLFTEYKKEDEYTWLTEASRDIVKQLNAFNTAAFNYGYCHYDYFPKNFFFDTENNFTLFDFDFAGRGYLANDLASIFVYFFFWVSLKKISEAEAAESFNIVVAGYREIRPITDEEIKAVPALGFLLLLFYLGFQYENFDDWSNSFFGPNYLSERIGAMKKYKEMYCDKL